MRRLGQLALLTLLAFHALLVLPAALGAAGVPLLPPGRLRDAGAALREGNHLFRGGDLDGALAAYAKGWDGANPVLAYNLGTTAHHLGRLPEALLWYRRAEAGLGGDPWLRDNLRLVREQLRAAERPPAPPSGALWALLRNSRPALLLLGIALAWTALPLALARAPRRLSATPRRRRMLAALAVASALAFGAGMLLPAVGPRPAVLLQDCAGAAGSLPAGSEVWAAPAPGGGWRLDGRESLRCPVGAVGWVGP